MIGTSLTSIVYMVPLKGSIACNQKVDRKSGLGINPPLRSQPKGELVVQNVSCLQGTAQRSAVQSSTLQQSVAQRSAARAERGSVLRSAAQRSTAQHSGAPA